jgi:uncharacterized protein YdiU (UPF0061 family)
MSIDAGAGAGPRALFSEPAAYDRWDIEWRSRMAAEPQDPKARAQAMRRVNPAYIPRNHGVEQVLNAAIMRDDFAPFKAFLSVLSRPYEAQHDTPYAFPAQPGERVLRTYCGT